MLLAGLVLAACGIGGPPEAGTAVDLTEFWQRRQ